MLAIELAALAALFVYGNGASVNYCGAAMCGMSNAHTFCQFIEGPGPKCSGYVDDHLSGEEKARVIGRMNRRRNEAALGKLQLPPANNMLKLRWVEELAREAQIWADQCSSPSYPEEHDACRDLYSITVGQCVASVVGEAPGLRPESMVDMWFLQGRQSAMSVYDTDIQKSTMDFAQMLWAYTYLVGCARSRFMIEQNGRLRTVTRLVCNFAPRGPEGSLWTPGPPASACPARSAPDPELPGLCTFHQDMNCTYDVTNATVLKEQSVLETILEIEQNSSLNYHGSLDQIYLTKMVTASINNQTEQEDQVKSTENNDMVEAETKDQESMLNGIDDNQHTIDNVTEEIINETYTERGSKKMLSTIGRPKSYNIEELNVVSKDFANVTEMTVTVKDDDTYNDYEREDILESNEHEMDNDVSLIERNVTIANSSHEIEHTTEALPPRISTVLTYTIGSIVETNPNISGINVTDHPIADVKTMTPYVQNNILKRLLDLSEKTEQNPSDPETARQLEEALENMEKVLASPLVSSKVRRDLRPDSQQQEPGNDGQNLKDPPQTQAQKLKDIGTPDSAPIMAIMTKYAPLIKSYQNIFSRSKSSDLTFNLVLFVLCSIVCNSL